MPRRNAVKFLAVLLVATLANAPSAFAACTRPSCPGGGPPCAEVLYDVNFVNTMCNAWTGDGAVAYKDGDDWIIPIDGTLHQDQDLSVYGSSVDMELKFEVEFIGDNPGTEQLKVEIRDAFNNNLLETSTIVWPLYDADGVIDIPTGFYNTPHGVRLMFKAVANGSPGNITAFRIKNCNWWVYSS
jgi:hypothetical protein